MKRRPKRSTVVLIATGLFLGLGLAFVVYATYSSMVAQQESEKIVVQLQELYRENGNRPDVEELRLGLDLRVVDVDALPMVEGLELQFVGVSSLMNATSQFVRIVFRGEEVASGWCFEVRYQQQSDAEVTPDSCAALSVMSADY